MKEEIGKRLGDGSATDRRLLYLTGMIEQWLQRDADFGTLITDENLIIQFCNEWIERRAPRLGKHLQGRTLLEVFPELAERHLDRYYREALEGRAQILSQRFHHYALALPADAADAAQSPMLQTTRIYPLIEDGRVAGTLTMIEDVTRRVLQEQKLRETIGNQEALIEALNRETEINQSMAELSAALISTDSLEEISAMVLKKALALTSSPLGFTGYIDPRTGFLVSPTLSREAWETCRIPDKIFIFEKFAGLWGWVLRNKAPLLTNDAAGDPRSEGLPPGHMPITRFLSAPALLDAELVGQVCVANAPRDYTDKDLFVIRRLANLHAMAIFRRQTETRLYALSVTDELTGLYNRRGFMTLAEQQLRIADRTKRGMLIIFLDLDGLKWINDRLGHHEGDAALRDMAGVLKKTFRESDIPARMGGDEFAVLALEGRPEDAEILSGNLQREIARHNETETRPYILSASIGAVCYEPGEPGDLETLLTRADRLMYEEKQKKQRDASKIIRPRTEIGQQEEPS